jgi:hypothetical protein
LIFCVVFFAYLVVPSPSFPTPPSDSLTSHEPGDTEDPLRRAYFTNFTREEVMDNYKKQFDKSTLFGIRIPTYRLNYGPEESQTIIRDQTRSTFLEEIVHPFRESVFVNGFEPKEAKDAVVINAVQWRQKITVRFVPSNLFVRLFVGALTLVMTFVLFMEFTNVKKRN